MSESLCNRLEAEVGQLLFDCTSLQVVIEEYIDYLRHQRRHQSLDQNIPIERIKTRME